VQPPPAQYVNRDRSLDRLLGGERRPGRWVHVVPATCPTCICS